MIAAVNVESFPDGQAVILEAIFGNSLTYDDSGCFRRRGLGAGVFIEKYFVGTLKRKNENFRCC